MCCGVLALLAGFRYGVLPARLPVSSQPAGLPLPRPVLVEALKNALATPLDPFAIRQQDYPTPCVEAFVAASEQLEPFQSYFTPLFRSETHRQALYEWLKPAARLVWASYDLAERNEIRRGLVHLHAYLTTYDHAVEERYWKRCQDNPALGEGAFVRFSPAEIELAWLRAPDAVQRRHPDENPEWRYSPAKALRALAPRHMGQFRRLEAFAFRRVAAGVSAGVLKTWVERLLTDFPVVLPTPSRTETYELDSATLLLDGTYALLRKTGKPVVEGRFAPRLQSAAPRFAASEREGIWTYQDVNGEVVRTESYSQGLAHGWWSETLPSGSWLGGFFQPEPARVETEWSYGRRVKRIFTRINGDTLRTETYPSSGIEALVTVWARPSLENALNPAVEDQTLDNTGWEGTFWSGTERYQEFYIQSPGLGVVRSAGWLKHGVWKQVDAQTRKLLAEERYEFGARRGPAVYFSRKGIKRKAVTYRSAGADTLLPLFDWQGRIVEGQSTYTGNFSLYTPRGNLKIAGEAVDDPLRRAWTVYYYDSTEKYSRAVERYVQNRLEGKCRYFNERGSLQYEIIFRNGSIERLKGNAEYQYIGSLKRFTPHTDRKKQGLFIENTTPPAEGRLVNGMKDGAWVLLDPTRRVETYKYGFLHDYLAEAEYRRRHCRPELNPQPKAGTGSPGGPARTSPPPLDAVDQALFLQRFRQGLPVPRFPEEKGRITPPILDWETDSTGAIVAAPLLISSCQSVITAYEAHLRAYPKDLDARARLVSFRLEMGQRDSVQAELQQLGQSHHPDAELLLFRAALSDSTQPDSRALRHLEAWLATRPATLDAFAQTRTAWFAAQALARNNRRDPLFTLLNAIPRTRADQEAWESTFPLTITADPRWAELW